MDITTIHLQKCPNLKVACPNSSCRKRVIRRDIASHRKECPFEEVPCKYARIGCNARIPRREREEHENDAERHLQLAVDTVSELKSKLDQQQMVIFTLRNFEQLKSDNKPVYCRPFYTGPRGYRMYIQVHANGTRGYEGHHVSVRAYLLPGENDDNLPWPFTGTVVIELLNQLQDANHHVRCLVFSKERESSQRVYDTRSIKGIACKGFITHSALGYDAVEHRQYLKDDCLCFRFQTVAPSPLPWLN